MDLPTCPACKQSVLDDDAVDCPFCGAPLKGGAARAKSPAGAQPATPKSAKASASSGATAGGGSQTRPSAAASTKEGPATPPPDDDPFAVDQSATAGAIQVSRQPAPGKSLEVACPMCETKGYVSTKAAGKLVKCCNPKCMVPIFSAPAIQKKEPVAAPAAPKKKLPWLYIAGGIFALGLVGVYVYLKNLPETNEIPPAPPSSFPTTASGSQATETASETVDKSGDEEQTPARDPETKARDELITQLLRRIREVSEKVKSHDKAAWRRLAAMAYIYAGERKRAHEELEFLQRGKQQTGYEAVLPFTELAWQDSGTADEFKQDVAEAERLAATLPTLGRYSTQAAIALAPELVVSQKADAARELLAAHRSKADIEQLAAALEIVINDKTFDLDRTLPGRSIGEWQAPLDTAVALILSAHGRWDEALAWASKSSDAVARTEGLLVWAEEYSRRAPADDADAFARATSAVNGLPADGAARALARLAIVKAAAGDRAASEELLKQALPELEKLPSHEPISVHDYKPLLDLKLPDSTELRQAALAITEVAAAQAKLGHAREAWNNILSAMRSLQAIAPSMTAMQQRAHHVDENPDRVTAEIAREMGLKTRNDQRLQFNRYKEKLRQVLSATRLRFDSEVDVLEAAANFGLLDQVWDELLVLDRKPNPDEREPLITSSVPLRLATLYGEQGNEGRRDEILRAVRDRVTPSDPRVVMRVTEDLLKSGDVATCLASLKESMTAEGVLHEWTLQAACRLMKSGKTAEALQFCLGLPDILRTEGLFLVSALAARSGRAQDVWHASSSIGGMEGTAICSGLVAGLMSQTVKAKP